GRGTVQEVSPLAGRGAGAGRDDGVPEGEPRGPGARARARREDVRPLRRGAGRRERAGLLVAVSREREQNVVEIGLFTEFEWRPGADEAQAFADSLAQMTAAEDLGYDAVWLAELHFQKERSVLSSPLVVGAAIAARTKRVKIGLAVQVLPLSHPLRLAEDVATLDHVSRGRLDFGVGRSGLPAHYTGFNIPYSESQERFGEALLDGPRRAVGERIRRMSFDDVLREFAVYGTPESVIERLQALREALGYSKLCVWMNVGSRVPPERVLASMRLFAERVAPRLG